MDCGVPFCHWACPVDNIMPEWQELITRGEWKEAFDYLQDTNNFPEFTGRVCPALCEASCVLSINDSAVTIRQNELGIIEKAFNEGYVKANPPENLEVTFPIWTYDHTLGCSVTGGYVYRGQQLSDWYGVYLYGDYCSGNIWGLLQNPDLRWKNEFL